MKNIIAFGEGRLHLRGFPSGSGVIGNWLMVIGYLSGIGEPWFHRGRLLSGAEKKVFAAVPSSPLAMPDRFRRRRFGHILPPENPASQCRGGVYPLPKRDFKQLARGATPPLQKV
jgi:hypothetical protein